MKRLLFNSFVSLALLFTFSASHAQSSLDFAGDYRFATLPSNFINTVSGSYTIEFWFYRRSAPNWDRIFDFGSNTTAYMFFTPQNSITGTPRFGITIAGGGAPEQLITAPTSLSLNTWHHIAIVVQHATNTGTMYINGTAVASNTGMTLRPSDLGTTTNNWLGRSQYGPDPYYNGLIDKFRVSTIARYTADFTPQRTPYTVDANTLAVYEMDEGTGQVITDGTGNFNGVLGANSGTEPADPSWSSNFILPVKLHYFRASQSGGHIFLEWQTSEEINNLGFYVERSTNSINFETIGFQAAKGSNAVKTDYRMQDAAPLQTTAYYRLKQVDLDGKITYSKVVKVAATSQAWLQVLNNGSSAVVLRLDDGNTEPYQVYDFAGKMVKAGNLVQGSAFISALPAGGYRVSIVTANKEKITTTILIR